MRLLTILSILILAFSSCKKENPSPNNKPITIPVSNMIEVKGNGFVIDKDGNAIEGASISLGDATAQSNDLGYFTIVGLGSEDLTRLKVEADGYYNAFPAINPISGKTHEFRVKMQERLLSKTLTSQDGGIVSLSNGSELSFAANGFENLDGTSYEGAVNIYSYYLDPTRDDLIEIMPGNLSSVNQESEVQLLQSFAMMNIELETDSGDPLQINQDAQLSFIVPDALQSSAPSEIPLWYFDEESGYWLEEGKAQLINGMYVGDVSHFTFWNCDVPSNFINLSGQVTDPRGEGVYQVCITQVSTDYTYCTYTTIDGLFEGYVPNDEDLIIEVFDHCKTAIYTANIGPYNNDANLGVITVSTNNSTSLINGVVLDCDGNPVSNGRVYVKLNNDPISQMIHLEADGSFSSVISICNSTEIIIKAYDLDNLVESDPLEFSIEANINVGAIAACGNQISVGAEFDFAPNYFELFTPVTLNTDGQGLGDSIDLYQFEFEDDLGGGDKVIYTYTIINWANTPANPLFAYSYETQIFGNPSKLVTAQGGDIELIQNGVESGDQVIIQLTDASIEILNPITGISESHNGGLITFSGIIE